MLTNTPIVKKKEADIRRAATPGCIKLRSLLSSPSSSQARNLNYVPAQAESCSEIPLLSKPELSLDIQLCFKPEPSLVWILSLLASQVEPALLGLFGSSRLEL